MGVTGVTGGDGRFNPVCTCSTLRPLQEALHAAMFGVAAAAAAEEDYGRPTQTGRRAGRESVGAVERLSLAAFEAKSH